MIPVGLMDLTPDWIVMVPIQSDLNISWQIQDIVFYTYYITAHPIKQTYQILSSLFLIIVRKVKFLTKMRKIKIRSILRFTVGCVHHHKIRTVLFVRTLLFSHNFLSVGRHHLIKKYKFTMYT